MKLGYNVQRCVSTAAQECSYRIGMRAMIQQQTQLRHDRFFASIFSPMDRLMDGGVTPRHIWIRAGFEQDFQQRQLLFQRDFLESAPLQIRTSQIERHC